MLTLKEFNTLYLDYQRKKHEAIGAYYIKPFCLYSKKTMIVKKHEHFGSDGIPYETTEKIMYDKPREVFNVNEFNRLIIEYLKMFTNPIKASITNTTGKYIKGVGYIKNKADAGRADITAQYPTFELCIETKQRHEKQLNSQIEFEQMANAQSFRKYVLCRDFEVFQEKISKIFTDLP